MSKKKVYLIDDYIVQMIGIFGPEDIEGKILKAAGYEFIKTSCYNEDEIIEKCADADIVFSMGTAVGPKIMDGLKKCKAYLRYGIGYEMLDVDAATKRGIMICNMPRYCIDEVATQSITLALAASRQILNQCLGIRSGTWTSQKLFAMHSNRFRTFGFLGFGNIARKASEFAKSFGFKLIAFDPYIDDALCKKYGVQKVSKEELLAQADIISVHTPLTDETFHLLDKPDFAKMKDGVIIVNTSRGSVISTEALVEALQSGKVAAAGLDVVEGEPIMDTNHPLLKINNVIMTPHMGADTVEAIDSLREEMANTAIKILQGEVPYNVVNKKALGR